MLLIILMCLCMALGLLVIVLLLPQRDDPSPTYCKHCGGVVVGVPTFAFDTETGARYFVHYTMVCRKLAATPSLWNDNNELVPYRHRHFVNLQVKNRGTAPISFPQRVKSGKCLYCGQPLGKFMVFCAHCTAPVKSK